ncbi:MAG: hypothetical protein AABX70_04140 [Nanoarchaeota archaeon]
MAGEDLGVVVDCIRANQLVGTLEGIDMSQIDKRLVGKVGDGDFVGGLRREAVRFLGIAAAGEGHFAPSKIVDAYWHELVLNTPLYARVAEAMGVFVHHNPTENPERESFQRTLEAYTRVFGESVPAAYWAKGDAADCASFCSGGACTTCTN